MKESRNKQAKNSVRSNSRRRTSRVSRIVGSKKFSLIFVTLALAVGFYIVAVRNVPGLNPFQAHAWPSHMVCMTYGSRLCLNRQGGGGVPGQTNIIAWSWPDNHNNFMIYPLYYACGAGVVTYNPSTGKGCPFITKEVNARYVGKPIVEIREAGVSSDRTAHCVGTDPRTSAGLLSFCADLYGNNGGYGTLFVAPQWKNTGNPTTYLVNRFWSDHDGAPRWLCLYARGVALMDYSGTNEGYCQFNEIYAPVPI